MEGYSKAGGESDFPDRRLRNVPFQGINVVVVKAEGSYYAFENNCPHQHFALLHEGGLDGCSLTCPMHGWMFDLKSGKATNGNGQLRMMDVKVVEGSVWIGNAKSETSYRLFE